MSATPVDILCLDLRHPASDGSRGGRASAVAVEEDGHAGPELFAAALPATLLEVVRRFQVMPHPRSYLFPEDRPDPDNGHEVPQLGLLVMGGPYQAKLVLRPPYTLVQAHRRLDQLARELHLYEERRQDGSAPEEHALTTDEALRQLQLSSEYISHRNILFLTAIGTWEDFSEPSRRGCKEIDQVFSDFAKMGTKIQIFHMVGPGRDMAGEAMTLTSSSLARIAADYADVSLEIRRLSQICVARLLMQGAEPRPADLRLEFPPQGGAQGFELGIDARPAVRQLDAVERELVCRCHRQPIKHTHFKETADRAYCAQTRQKLPAADVLPASSFGQARWITPGAAEDSRRLALARPRPIRSGPQRLRIWERVPTNSISSAWLFGQPLLVGPTTNTRLEMAEIERQRIMLQTILHELDDEGESLILSCPDQRSPGRQAIWVLTPECGCGSSGGRCARPAVGILQRMASAEQLICGEEADQASLADFEFEDRAGSPSRKRDREMALLQLGAVKAVTECNPLRYRAGLQSEVLRAADSALE